MSSGAATADTPADNLDFGAWKPTGRKTAGPDSELIEIENPDGHKHTAVVFDKAWRSYPQLTTDVEMVQSFMEFPMVEGISCMTRWVQEQAIFQYETGSVLALIEILRAYRDTRKPVGLRAGCELMIGVGNMLQEAAENGPMQGIYNHGGLTPWRILLDAEGSPQILGYGLPQIDMVALREDESLKVRDDSFKYCPPERLTSGYEDITTDLYALTLIAFEIITGDSLIKGRTAELKQQVTLGEAHQSLIKAKKALPKALHEVMVHALAFDPIGRYEHPWEYVQAITEAIGSAKLPGETLAEVLQNVRTTTRRGKALMDVGTAGGPRRAGMTGDGRATRMKSATAARPVAGPRGASARGSASAVSGEGRWGKVARSGQEEEEETTTRRGAVAGRPTRRGRRGAEPQEEAAPTRARRRGASAEEPEPEETTSRRARRRGAEPEPEPEEATSRRGRLRRSAGTSSDQEDSAPSRRSRVRRSASSEGDSEPVRSRRSRSSDTEAEQDDSPASRRSRARRSASTSSDSEPVRSRRSRSSDTETEQDDSSASRRGRLRRSASNEDDSEPVRSRRSRTSTDAEPEEDSAPVRSRRSRTSTDAEPEEDSAPVRSRRSRTSTDAEPEEDSAPVRSRRSRTSTSTDAEPEEDSAPVRSRRSKKPSSDDSEDSEDKPKASKPTRSRRSKKPSSDDSEDSEDKPKASKPTRSRRSKKPSSDTSDDSDDSDDSEDKPKASKPTRSRRSRKR